MPHKISLILLCLIAFSCKNGMFDAGDPATKEFIFSNDIWVAEIENIFEIKIIQDTINKAVVTCGENLMPDMDIYETDHVIYLNHHVDFDWTRDYEKIKLTLHLSRVPWLNIRKPVSLSTIGTIYTDHFDAVVWTQFSEITANIVADNFMLVISLDDFGKYKITGTSNTAYIETGGSGFVDCGGLKSEKCFIKQQSIADSYVNVTKELSVQFKERGNIYYTGNPDTIIYLNQPISGKLIKWEPKNESN
jgi:hypothetical protein